MADIIPSDRKRLRACMLCGLVKSVSQFKSQGCENCEDILHLQNDLENIGACTSSNFDGLIAMMKPDASWVAKWQRVDKFTKGMYAIRVAGRLPQYVIDDLAVRNIVYRPRDGSEAITLPGRNFD